MTNGKADREREAKKKVHEHYTNRLFYWHARMRNDTFIPFRFCIFFFNSQFRCSYRHYQSRWIGKNTPSAVDMSAPRTPLNQERNTMRWHQNCSEVLVIEYQCKQNTTFQRAEKKIEWQAKPETESIESKRYLYVFMRARQFTKYKSIRAIDR